MATAIRSGVITGSPGEPCAWPAFESLEAGVHGLRRAVGEVRHATEAVAADAVSNVRAHPLRAVGVAMATGAVVGAAAGFVFGWRTRTRT